MGRNELFNDYDAFVKKFEPKKTTDDCYTPPKVYDTVLAWVRRRYAIPDDAPIVRPFFPGGDYENAEYPEGCVVVDNPPFSIMSRILRFYTARGIRFFLFAPQLTLFSNARDPRIGFVCAAASITYANGAVVNTGFVTNMGENVAETAPDLREAIKAACAEIRKEKSVTLPKYTYPVEVATAARLGWLSVHGETFRVRRGDAAFVSSLDNGGGKGIFGGGLLLSERAAAERAAAERAAATVFELSPREREIQKLLGRRAD